VNITKEKSKTDAKVEFSEKMETPTLENNPSKPLHELLGKDLSRPVIECKGLLKSYKLKGQGDREVLVLRRVDLCRGTEFYPVLKGEFVMIRGESGCGKTTFLNCISTIDKPTHGSVNLFGEKVDFTKDDAMTKLRLEKIGFVFQTFNLLPALSAYENVELPMIMAGNLTKKQMRTRAKQLLQSVGLEDRMGHLPSELSGGEQQRVTIARALANDPELVILDEPTGDLDTRTTIDIMNLLLEINQKKRVTMLMVTHNASLECYADRVLFFADGQIEKQAINARQTRLHKERHLKYLDASTQ